jgi:hypothetical protein
MVVADHEWPRLKGRDSVSVSSLDSDSEISSSIRDCEVGREKVREEMSLAVVSSSEEPSESECESESEAEEEELELESESKSDLALGTDADL